MSQDFGGDSRLSRELKVPPRRINEIVHGKRGITIDTALGLFRHFGTSAELWINLQTHLELEVAEDNNLVETTNKEVFPRLAAALDRVSLKRLHRGGDYAQESNDGGQSRLTVRPTSLLIFYNSGAPDGTRQTKVNCSLPVFRS